MPIEQFRLLKVGNFITFSVERCKYEVRARNDRFLVCTKPFPMKRTVVCTVVDLQQQVRGIEDSAFGAETQEQCEAMLARLTAGQTKISRRSCTKLYARILWID